MDRLNWSQLTPTMQSIASDLRKLDTASQIRFINELQKPEEEQSAEYREMIDQIGSELKATAKTPPALLPPAL